MRSAPERDVSFRDAALPGLAVALDAENFMERLQAAVPQVLIHSADITYIRYKPRTNCLVMYRLETTVGPLDVYAKAHTVAAREKLRKAAKRVTVPTPLGHGRLVFPEHALNVCVFPNDDKLRALTRLANARSRSTLLRRVFAERPELWEGTTKPLRYKPERRFVTCLQNAAEPRAALRFYTHDGFAPALRAAQAVGLRGRLRIARLLGCSRRHNIVGLEWVQGRALAALLPSEQLDPSVLAGVGAALAELHAQTTARLDCRTRDHEIAALHAAAAAVGTVLPAFATRADTLAQHLGRRLATARFEPQPVHGDFYAEQVLLAGDEVVLLDLDRAALGDAPTDLGNFLAHLERAALDGRLARDRVAEAGNALLSGYQVAARRLERSRLTLHTAASLLRLAPEPFRRHLEDWPAQTGALLERVEEIASASRAPLSAARTSAVHESVAVIDPSGAAADRAMPFLADATDPELASRCLLERLGRRGWADGEALGLRAIRVTRLKPGRRCVIEYDLVAAGRGCTSQAVTLVGKSRARGTDLATFRLLRFLSQAGFSCGSADGISVPEPVVLVPEFRMGVQRKAAGEPATRLLAGPTGLVLARRIAEALHKLHGAGAPTRRRHTRHDELVILRDRLGRVASARPRWRPRLDRLFDACTALAAGIRGTATCGIHRDFYPDQVLVEGSRVCLLDFDLFCAGDPALDVGNYVAHVIELSLRTFGNPHALEDRNDALVTRFAELAGEEHRSAIRAYTTLSLARHIYIATQLADRHPFAGTILELCEQRLGIGDPQWPSCQRTQASRERWIL